MAASVPAGAHPDFTEAECALLRALRLMGEGAGEEAIDALRPHFDVDGDQGEIGQIVYAYGMYRGLHTANAALGVEFLDADGTPLRDRPGFSVVTTADGRFAARQDFDLS